MNDEKPPHTPSKELTDAIGSFTTDALTDALNGQTVFFGSAGEELRRAMEGTATAASALRESVDRLPDFTYSPPTYQEPMFDPGVLVENSTHETNEILSELSLSIKALVDVAKNQANLTEQIRKATETALGYAITSSNDAATATKLVRYSIWIAIFSVFIGTAVTLYLDNRNNAVANAHFADEKIMRQQELRTLNDISAQLAAEAKARSQATASKSVAAKKK